MGGNGSMHKLKLIEQTIENYPYLYKNWGL